MNSSILRLVPAVSLFGLLLAACGSGEVSGDTDGVLGMREGGRGVTFTAGGLEALCARALDCSPAATGMATVDDCVELLDPMLDELLADAPPACAAAVEGMLGCMGAVAECANGELVPPPGACSAEEARIASACEGWEPNLDLDIESYDESAVPIDGADATDG